jgi:hypothetical protein
MPDCNVRNELSLGSTRPFVVNAFKYVHFRDKRSQSTYEKAKEMM